MLSLTGKSTREIAAGRALGSRARAGRPLHGAHVPPHAPGNVQVPPQQHPSRQPELKLHGPPPGSFRVHAPPVQNSTDEH